MSGKKRVGILISGRGSNMEALIAAARDPEYPAEIVGVISNKLSAGGLETAQAAGIPVAVHPLKSYPDKVSADAAITETLESWDVEIVCLAGFMRILSKEFAEHWLERAINIHPSLLPKHKGLDTHQRALDAGDKVHGCTVHFVVPELDAGPVILQAEVPVLPGDDAAELAARVLVEEHRIYPQALALVASGAAGVENGQIARG